MSAYYNNKGAVTLNSSLSVFFFFFFFFFFFLGGGGGGVTVGYIRYQHRILLKSYDLKIESFWFLFGSSFYIKTFKYK